MISIIGTFLSILSSLTGQLGPNYDPLFYDVMIYLYGTVIFSIFIIGIIVWMVRRRKKSSKISASQNDDTMFYGCPRCGRNTQIISGRQYCTVCRIYY